MDCSYQLLRRLKEFLVDSGVYEKYERHFINYVIRLLYTDYTARNRSPESKREMGEKIQSWLDEFQVNRYELSYYNDLEKYEALLPKDLRPDIHAQIQSQRADRLQHELENHKKRADALQYDLDCVHHSVSFRIGRGITYLPRKLRGGVQCLREHGAGYTFRRILYHIGLSKDKESQRKQEEI